ncbi:F-box/LRR-repeat protein 2-like [Solenopsis invicta]|uniref:F-box/LRR-repeat protein 2-like n=1 Tax=Solenopsis invicta TaxID=13686 RepID=UPI00193E13AC|nr:F-box/LRR-repeat protein 2-like [Solenopsis invicta]
MEIYKHCTSHKNYLNYEKFLEDLQLLWKESKKPITCSFPQLPDEIIIKIFSCLDLKSLSRISRVNKRLNNLSQDPKFYKSLNIRNIHYTYWRFSFDDIFLYFASRCKYLTQVDLSFCTFSVSAFNKFLATCGKLLTDLRLNNCPLINDSAVHQISTICRNLKGLDLNGCNCVNDQGLSYLINLESLERLHLENVKALNAVTVCKILQSNRQMRDLNLARMCSILNLNEIAIRLKTLCPNLERINLAKTNLPSKAIDALADCKNLQEVNFRNAWTNCGYTPSLRDSFHRLFSSCQRLEKIDLSFNHLLPSYVLETLTLCKNLKCLMLIKVTSVTPATLRDTCFEILLQCPKLEEIYLPFMVTNILTDHWNERYQNVTIFSFD